jgi:hypothetical protein
MWGLVAISHIYIHDLTVHLEDSCALKLENVIDSSHSLYMTVSGLWTDWVNTATMQVQQSRPQQLSTGVS